MAFGKLKSHMARTVVTARRSRGNILRERLGCSRMQCQPRATPQNSDVKKSNPPELGDEEIKSPELGHDEIKTLEHEEIRLI